MRSAPLASNFCPALPVEMRRPIETGLRWTLWLAAASWPVGLAARLLLARAGPGVLGAYGVLLIYLAFTSTVLYFGGNAIVIRYLPLLAAEARAPFLARYAAVVAAGLIPWWVLFALRPELIARLFGDAASGWGAWLLLAAVPVPILLALLTASLKGLLDIKAAQLIARAATITALGAYGLLCLISPRRLRAHPTAWLWGIALGLMLAGAWAAWRRLRRRLPRARAAWRGWPVGFWRYAWGLQGNSAITFASRQLDLILILGLGSRGALGIYLVWLTLVGLAPTMLEVALEALLPSLTHALALARADATEELVAAFGRLLLPAALAVALALMLFPAPIVGCFGARYAPVIPWVRWAAPWAAIVAASHLFGTLLTASGQPQRLIGAHAARIAIFAASFPALWHWRHLAGTAVGWLAAELAYHLLAWRQARRHAPWPEGLRRAYVALWPVLAAGAATAVLASAPARAVAWAALLAAYWCAAGYQPRELRMWVGTLLAAGAASELDWGQ